MVSRWETIDTSDGQMRCYLSVPGEPGPHPAVIVIQHAGGVDEFIRRLSDGLAEAGFVAVAPDLYHREDPKSSDDPMTRMGRLRDVNIVADVNAAVEHVSGLAAVRGESIGITGFCMGGRVAYLMAASNAVFQAAVVFYGGNTMVPWGRGQAPFDISAQIGCPILGLFGKEDPNPNPADVAKIDAELTRLGKPHEFHSYPSAGHAFMSEGRPNYREEAATDAWPRCIEWFGRYLKP
jgi:carboxymethylenebutenolidase